MDEMIAKISIIVPYHNSEKYIAECIESIEVQSYKYWELILVDDASTDNSVGICASFAKNDDRIRMIASKGRGVSAARNNGLLVAEGEYVTFIDSDDWIEIDALKKMKEEIKENDFISTSYQRVMLGSKVEKRLVGNNTLSSGEYLVALYNSNRVYQGYCWGKLYKLSVIQEYNIRFNTEISYNEDRLFVLEYIQKINEAVTSNSVTYNYRLHSESATGKITYDEQKLQKSINDELYTAKYMINLLQDNKEAQEWLVYNLLRKAYAWKHQMKEGMALYNQILETIETYKKKILFSKHIGLLNKLKLLKSAVCID